MGVWEVGVEVGGRSGGRGWSWVLLGESFAAIARVRG